MKLCWSSMIIPMWNYIIYGQPLNLHRKCWKFYRTLFLSKDCTYISCKRLFFESFLIWTALVWYFAFYRLLHTCHPGTLLKLSTSSRVALPCVPTLRSIRLRWRLLLLGVRGVSAFKSVIKVEYSMWWTRCYVRKV